MYLTTGCEWFDLRSILADQMFDGVVLGLGLIIVGDVKHVKMTIASVFWASYWKAPSRPALIMACIACWVNCVIRKLAFSCDGFAPESAFHSV